MTFIRNPHLLPVNFTPSPRYIIQTLGELPVTHRIFWKIKEIFVIPRRSSGSSTCEWSDYRLVFWGRSWVFEDVSKHNRVFRGCSRLFRRFSRLFRGVPGVCRVVPARSRLCQVLQNFQEKVPVVWLNARHLTFTGISVLIPHAVSGLSLAQLLK